MISAYWLIPAFGLGYAAAMLVAIRQIDRYFPRQEPQDDVW